MYLLPRNIAELLLGLKPRHGSGSKLRFFSTQSRALDISQYEGFLIIRARDLFYQRTRFRLRSFGHLLGLSYGGVGIMKEKRERCYYLLLQPMW